MKVHALLKVGKSLTKILEIFHWVGAAILCAATVCALAAPALVDNLIRVTPIEGYGAPIQVYGFEMILPAENGMTALFLFGIGGTAILVLVSMIFHDLHRMLKNAETETPFQKDTLRMMKQIGAFSMAVPLVGLVMSVVTRGVMGADAIEMSVNLEGFCVGVIILSLTQFFIHGAELEEDVEGLL